MSKAFDKVWHTGILFKLTKYGIYGNLHNWFTSYLSDRRQRVINECFRSTWLPTSAGVQQGSVLCPYIFLISLNNMIDNLSSNIRSFADDTTLFTVIDDEKSINILNEALYKIIKWSDEWLIIFNTAKTTSMIFIRKRRKRETN